MGEYAELALEQMMDNVSGWGRTSRPRPYNQPLAAARCRAHAAFDPLWKSGEMSRSAAYRWLAGEMNLSKRQCHMENMSIEQCDHVVELCTKRAFSDLFK